MTQPTKAFTVTSAPFALSILTFILSLAAMAGIEFPSDPAQIADQIVTTVSSGGYFAVLGILATSIVGPVITFIRNGGFKMTWRDFFSRPNTWISIIGFALSLIIVIGIKIPVGTDAALVGAIYAKDWGALLAIAGLNLLNPFIRWLIDKNKSAVLAKNAVG